MVGVSGVLPQFRSLAFIQAVWRSRKAFLTLLSEKPDQAATLAKLRHGSMKALTALQPASGDEASAAQGDTRRRGSLNALNALQMLELSPKDKDKNLAISKAHASKWAVAGKLWDSRERRVNDAQVFKASARRASLQAERAHAYVKQVEDERQLSEVPYWNQGNADLYTDEALHARYMLRHHPAVEAVLQLWWSMVLRSVQAGGDPASALLEKRDYCTLLCMIYKALLKPYNQEDAYQAAEEDWANDCKGHQTMHAELFMDAMCARALLEPIAARDPRTA